MPKILSKGSNIALADSYADWDDKANLIDHQLAFYNLEDLRERNHEFAHPYFDFNGSVQLPSRSDVIEFLSGGNNMVLWLPEESSVHLKGESRDGEEEWYEFDPFCWLPISIDLNTEKSGTIVEADEEWEWYFGNKFDWNYTLSIYSNIRNTGPGYYDPRPSEDNVARSAQLPPSSAYFPAPEVRNLAVNNVDRSIAAKAAFRNDDITTDGQIYAIPSTNLLSFNEFAHGILEHEFGVELETNQRWVDEYAIPGEQNVHRHLSTIESKLELIEDTLKEGRYYRQMLFENDDELENSVRDAFRRFGLKVEGEKPGKRDGSIHLKNTTIILEITGTDSGVELGKIDRLSNHVRDAQKEGVGTNLSGLLVVNQFKKRDPQSRPLNVENFKWKLEEEGHKLIPTFDLYRMLCSYESGELPKRDVVSQLTDNELSIIRYKHSIEEPNTDIQSRANSISDHLDGLF